MIRCYGRFWLLVGILGNRVSVCRCIRVFFVRIVGILYSSIIVFGSGRRRLSGGFGCYGFVRSIGCCSWFFGSIFCSSCLASICWVGRNWVSFLCR